MSTPYQEEFVEVAGAKIQLLKGGQGDPLVMFHSTEGSLGWRNYHDQLAEHFTVYAPTLPGFGASERPDWVESFFDLARFSLWLVQALGLEKTALGGHFIGGWLAAEMAVMSPQLIDRLILVDAAGIQPQQGEITDIFLHGLEGTRQLTYFEPKHMPEYEELFGHKPSKEERNILVQNQETVVRYCWKPYMYDRSLAEPPAPAAHANPGYLGTRRSDCAARVWPALPADDSRGPLRNPARVRELPAAGKARRL